MKPPRARTREEMRELDRRAIAEFGIPGVILMENAGRRAADEASRLARPEDGPIAIVCGKGNNGGDGFVVARHLWNRGYALRVLSFADPAAADGATDAGLNARICARMGIPVEPLRDAAEARRRIEAALRGAALAVDALFGTGLEGAVREPYLSAIAALNAAPCPVLAIDIPSGLDADTGEVLGAAVRARRTVTLAAPKVGFARGKGPSHVGDLVVVEISIPRQLLTD